MKNGVVILLRNWVVTLNWNQVLTLNWNWVVNITGICNDEQKPKTGGTGHTMDICEINNVDYLTQKQWYNWI